MYPYRFFVLHSSYPDGSWRGVEKCSSTKDGPLLFDSPEGAEAALVAMGDTGDYFKVVEVCLVTPSVRKPLDSATWDKVNLVVPRPEVQATGLTLTCRVTTRCFVCGGDVPEGKSGVYLQGKGIRHEGCAS